MHPARLMLFGALILVACATIARADFQPRKPAAPSPNEAFEKYLRTELDTVRARAAETADLNDLGPSIDRLFDLAIAHAIPAADPALLGDINILRRIIRHLGALKPEQAGPVKQLLITNPELARRVVCAIGPDDHIAGAYRVLALLNERFPDRLRDTPPSSGKPRPGEGFAQPLAAAFCIVYDGEPGRASNGEPDTRQPAFDADRIAALFDYFSANAAKMQFGAGAAPELLAYIVSTPCSIEELNWALKNYAGNRMVGKLYGTIVYDTGAFKYNRPKKISKEPGGYTLMNIKKVGGVCAEQAYFAANVGRAIGVPAVIDSARGSDVGHAWVGYLKLVGSNRYDWDFDEGRYKEYQSIRGNTTDPQSGKPVPDGFVALTAGYAAIPTVKREGAIALFDAADRIAAVELAKTPFPPSLPDSAPKPATEPRAVGIATQLDLIEKGLTSCHVSRRGWDMVNRLAAAEKLGAEQLEKWFTHTIDLCGSEYPDFCLSALSPMIRSLTPPEAQDKQWEWLHGKFNRRKDLAAAVRFEQGQMWENNGNNAKAWEMYNDVIHRYANDGQIIVEALRVAERLLDKQGKSDQVLNTYQVAFGRISKPEKMSNEFAAGSTYVAVGQRYAALLETAGRASEAKRIRDQVAQVIGKEK
ncbi:MAG: hypothetical protein IT438_07665 [Phycisphaerales bacterium]|nr:hypothetical protein [Phycisphaerales bacterium]